MIRLLKKALALILLFLFHNFHAMEKQPNVFTRAYVYATRFIPTRSKPSEKSYPPLLESTTQQSHLTPKVSPKRKAHKPNT